MAILCPGFLSFELEFSSIFIFCCPLRTQTSASDNDLSQKLRSQTLLSPEVLSIIFPSADSTLETQGLCMRSLRCNSGILFFPLGDATFRES